MTKTQIQTMIDRYYQAELDLLDGKTVTWGARMLQQENLAEIRKGRQEWEQRLAALNRTGPGFSLARF